MAKFSWVILSSSRWRFVLLRLKLEGKIYKLAFIKHLAFFMWKEVSYLLILIIIIVVVIIIIIIIIIKFTFSACNLPSCYLHFLLFSWYAPFSPIRFCYPSPQWPNVRPPSIWITEHCMCLSWLINNSIFLAFIIYPHATVKEKNFVHFSTKGISRWQELLLIGAQMKIRIKESILHYTFMGVRTHYILTHCKKYINVSPKFKWSFS